MLIFRKIFSEFSVKKVTPTSDLITLAISEKTSAING